MITNPLAKMDTIFCILSLKSQGKYQSFTGNIPYTRFQTRESHFSRACENSPVSICFTANMTELDTPPGNHPHRQRRLRLTEPGYTISETPGRTKTAYNRKVLIKSISGFQDNSAQW